MNPRRVDVLQCPTGERTGAGVPTRPPSAPASALLWVILGGFALLGANGVYLASVTALTWATGAPSRRTSTS